ncbi:putative Tic20 family protein [Sporomusaceae bacterium BoRhaA]|uniref:hypothetical protein n=1 Tax=Pelorhabdus rhamnosifermentans TaxID=2772457 RepID=UPI001C062DC8|nr:hypothetical protein [Pelorhabdus rhamnosifermentans]MBU2703404.1 putative Tic20 family protein [Pelorhabdus rhamnosifermentans]
MENYEIKKVRKYLNIQVDAKKVRYIYFPLFVFELMCWGFYPGYVGNGGIIIAVIIFFSMLIWGEIIRVRGKNLFLYMGVGMSLWSLCSILLVLYIVHADFFQGLAIGIGILLLSVPAAIWLVRRNAQRILSGKAKPRINLPMSCYSAAGSLAVATGCVTRRWLSQNTNAIVAIVAGIFVACGCLYAAIERFYKHIIRRRYHIDELLEQKAKAKVKQQ